MCSPGPVENLTDLSGLSASTSLNSFHTNRGASRSQPSAAWIRNFWWPAAEGRQGKEEMLQSRESGTDWEIRTRRRRRGGGEEEEHRSHLHLSVASLCEVSERVKDCGEWSEKRCGRRDELSLSQVQEILKEQSPPNMRMKQLHQLETMKGRLSFF